MFFDLLIAFMVGVVAGAVITFLYFVPIKREINTLISEVRGFINQVKTFMAKIEGKL